LKLKKVKIKITLSITQNEINIIPQLEPLTENWETGVQSLVWAKIFDPWIWLNYNHFQWMITLVRIDCCEETWLIINFKDLSSYSQHFLIHNFQFKKRWIKDSISETSRHAKCFDDTLENCKFGVNFGHEFFNKFVSFKKKSFQK